MIDKKQRLEIVFKYMKDRYLVGDKSRIFQEKIIPWTLFKSVPLINSKDYHRNL